MYLVLSDVFHLANCIMNLGGLRTREKCVDKKQFGDKFVRFN